MLLAVALMISAQELEPPRLGTRIPHPVDEDDVSTASDREGYMVAQRMGACLVKSRPEDSMRLVTAAARSDAANAAFAKLRPRMSSCLGVAAAGTPLMGTLKLQFSDTILRGVVAEALYRRHSVNFANLAGVRASVPVAPIFVASQSDAEARDLAVTYAFAQCLTASNPGLVRSIALSKIGSKEEKTAFAALNRHMPACLLSGTTLKTKRAPFRFMLAEALYRWSAAATHAPRTGTL